MSRLPRVARSAALVLGTCALGLAPAPGAGATTGGLTLSITPYDPPSHTVYASGQGQAEYNVCVTNNTGSFQDVRWIDREYHNGQPVGNSTFVLPPPLPMNPGDEQCTLVTWDANQSGTYIVQTVATDTHGDRGSAETYTRYFIS